MIRKIFNCQIQRSKDIQNFISIGSSIVYVIKKRAVLKEEIQKLEAIKKKYEYNIQEIKDAMVKYVVANGNRSDELNSKLNEKENEYQKLLSRLKEIEKNLYYLDDEYRQYISYIQDSQYKFDIFKMCLEIDIQYLTKDELLTILIAIFGSIEYHAKTVTLEYLKNECINKEEEEYKRLIDRIKSVKDVERYIEENY